MRRADEKTQFSVPSSQFSESGVRLSVFGAQKKWRAIESSLAKCQELTAKSCFSC